MLKCIYTVLLIFGGGYISISYFVGEIHDWGENLLEGMGEATEHLLEGLSDFLGMDVDLDFGHTHIHVDTGPGPFSIRTLLFFGTGFGAGGLIGYALGWSDFTTLIPAFGTGLILAFFAYLILRLMWKGQGTTNIDRTDYVGLMGTVVITIPEGGKGQIKTEIMLHKKLLSAKSHDGGLIPSGTNIFIIQIDEGGTCIVRVN